MPYAIDNGAWTSHQRGEPFDEGAFLGILDRLGERADWIVVPDVVCGGLDSLRLSETWLPRLESIGRLLLIPVQNGMEPADVRPLVGPKVGIFVGGDDRWKETTMPAWGRLAQGRSCHLHIGRVNSARRIKLSAISGAHSFDGTSASRYARSLPLLDHARRQITLPFS